MVEITGDSSVEVYVLLCSYFISSISLARESMRYDLECECSFRGYVGLHFSGGQLHKWREYSINRLVCIHNKWFIMRMY